MPDTVNFLCLLKGTLRIMKYSLYGNGVKNIKAGPDDLRESQT